MKDNKAVFRSWALYDWANSVYSLCISTAIFPLYYSLVTNPDDLEGATVQFFGFEIVGAALLSGAISVSFLVVVILIPFLSGIADAGGRKKLFMSLFVSLGSFSCMMLYFFVEGQEVFGILFAMLASIGFAGSLVFYNAFLPEIASPKHFERLSARGFSMGYIGSVLLLIICLTFIMNPHWLGLSSELTAMRWSFVAVGIWWFVFGMISIKGIHEKKISNSLSFKIMTKGYKEIKSVWLQLKGLASIQRFLMAFFLYSTGVLTVIYMAGIYAKEALGFESASLILIILIIQVVAAAGAFTFARLAERYGTFTMLIVQVFIWSVICLLAFLVVKETAWLFYIVAFLVGLVLGGIQSLSRAAYSRLLPETKDHASFFSFYEMTEKTATVLGTLSFATVAQLSGGMRNSVLVLMLFFLAAIPFLFPLRKKERMKL